jgi:L-threonylcarbamoyladenylate synthase
VTDKTTAIILPTHKAELFETAVRRAAELLCHGDVVALPTETVYGLAANALNAEAVAHLYEIKGRPAHNPIIVHIASMAMARRCVTHWPAAAANLARAFWPGPLTLVLPRANNIPDTVTASGPTVGVRWPSHPFIQAVIRRCKFPLAAPSANLASRLSPTTAAHVRAQLGHRIPLIVDGGPAAVGIESTVLDLTTSPPRVLRPGMIHAESLAAIVGEVTSDQARVVGKALLRSPGLLVKHYAPKAKMLVLRWHDEADLQSQLVTDRSANVSRHVLAHTHIPSGSGFAGVSVLPRDAAAFARVLYAELHRCDEAGAQCIVVEAPPAGPEWRAIADRLHRAAAGESPA